MRRNIISPLMILTGALLMIAAGILIIVFPNTTQHILFAAVDIFLLSAGLLTIFSFVFRKDKVKTAALLNGIIYIVLWAAVRSNPDLLLTSIARVTAVWALINAGTHLMTAAQMFQNESREYIRKLITGLGSAAAGILFFLFAADYILVITILSGVYVMVMGCMLFWDFIHEVLAVDLDGKLLKRRIHLALPVFLVAFIPQRVCSYINEKLAVNDEKALESVTIQPDRNIHTAGQLEIFIHLANDVAMGFGHVDTCFDGYVYSYGCYDGSTNRLFDSISDGVLAKSPREAYIKHCLEYEKKVLVGFTIALSEERHIRVTQAIAELMDCVHPWQCNAEKGIDSKDAASGLQRAANARFYKFQKKNKYSAFRTYFLLTTNCVGLSDRLLKNAGMEILDINGIITPGTYFSRLEYLFLRKNSIVTKRTVYKSDVPAE